MAYLGPPPSQKIATPTSQYFSGNGSTTAFTLNRPVNVAEDLNVFVNNVAQQPGSGKSYTATGTTLTFDAAPDSGTNNVYVVYRGLAEPTTRLEIDANSSITAATGTFTGAFTSPGIDDNADATAITIDSSERVGIGVTSMTNKLVLPNAAYFAMQDTSAAESLAIRANSSNAMEILTGGGVKATIDSSGRTTIPNQPLFVAHSPIVGTSGAEAASGVRYKRWTTVLHNIGSHFNNDSGGGFFTAPVAGRYYILMKAGHKVTYNAWCGMYLYDNGTNIVTFWDQPDSSSNGTYNSNNASIVLDLAANDTCGIGYHTTYSDLSANSNNFISIGLLH